MGCKIVQRVTWLWPPPFQGRFLSAGWDFAMVNQCTKFEVSMFTHYEAMNGCAKCRKLGGLGQLGVTQGHPRCHHRAHTSSYSTLIETMRLSCTIFEILQVICRKSPILTHQPAFGAPIGGSPRSNFAEILGASKLESLSYRVALFVWSYV